MDRRVNRHSCFPHSVCVCVRVGLSTWKTPRARVRLLQGDVVGGDASPTCPAAHLAPPSIHPAGHTWRTHGPPREPPLPPPAQVVTDFTTCHNTWFHKGATRCFVPTEYCSMLARDNGLEDEQIIQHGALSVILAPNSLHSFTWAVHMGCSFQVYWR